MPVDQTQLNTERIDALFRVLEEAGVASPEHLAELRETDDLFHAAEVAEAHANGDPPPTSSSALNGGPR